MRRTARLNLECLEERQLLSYTITDLGPGFAYGLNNAGQVVGVSNGQAVLWQDGASTALGAGSSRAINDVGQIVGRNQIDTTRHAFVWDSVSGMRDLGALPGQTYSAAHAINGTGQIAGESRSRMDTTPRAVLWNSNGDIQDLGTFGRGASVAAAINDAGQAVGWAEDGSGQSSDPSYQYYQYLSARDAFLWDPSGVSTLLGPLPGHTASKATDINDFGQVVGSSGDITFGGPYSVRYRALEAVVWQDGVMTGLGKLPGDLRSEAVAVNNAGQVVGYSTAGSLPLSGGRPVLWANGIISDLTSLTGRTFYSVTDINDLGQIIASDGANAFLLTPDNVTGLRIDDVTMTEGNAGIALATFTVTRSGPLGGTTTVQYATADSTAAADSDYEAAGGTLTFAPDEGSKTITIRVHGDTADELNESFFVRLSAATGAAILDGEGVGTIVNDDVPPALSISDVTMTEGNSGVRYFTFTVSLSAASGKTISVSFATANGTAKVSDRDYLAASGTLTFAPGETTKTITVQVKGDRKKEANETFFVNLTGAVDATILDGQGLGTILNDDH